MALLLAAATLLVFLFELERSWTRAAALFQQEVTSIPDAGSTSDLHLFKCFFFCFFCKLVFFGRLSSQLTTDGFKVTISLLPKRVSGCKCSGNMAFTWTSLTGGACSCLTCQFQGTDADSTTRRLLSCRSLIGQGLSDVLGCCLSCCDLLNTSSFICLTDSEATAVLLQTPGGQMSPHFTSQPHIKKHNTHFLITFNYSSLSNIGRLIHQSQQALVS